jgi:predicted Zn-dependent protease
MCKDIVQNPTNAEFIYWLAQACFDNGDADAANAALDKYMQGELGSNPLLLVAKGQYELAKNKPADARQRFETAISLSKGKNVEVFNAIGKAHLEKGGDPAYGIGNSDQRIQRSFHLYHHGGSLPDTHEWW